MSRLWDLDTIMHADSVEWCPTQGLEEILACGTYQLNERDNIREGAVSLFSWDSAKCRLTRVLEKECGHLVSGVLDMKWKSLSEKSVLSVAAANGMISFLQLNRDKDVLTLQDLGKKGLSLEGTTHDALCLSLDWAKLTSSVAISDSLGQVGIIELCPTGPRPLRVWKAHSYEAWIVCFGHCSDVLFSGGDDCRLHCWDLREGTDRPSATSKWHEMGVCSLQSHPTDNNILASGSYDEHLALWDIRNLSRPLKDKSLGGGLWRIKWNSSKTNLIAAACMHNHFCVVDTHLATSEPVQVLEEYKEHGSLAYGVDWCGILERVDVQKPKYCFTLASCSFYDDSLHLWTVLIDT